MNFAQWKIAVYVLLSTLIISAIEFIGVVSVTENNNIRVTRFTEIFAFMAILYLYVVVISFPLRALSARVSGYKYRRQLSAALAISALYFAVLHTLLAFFTQLGGFSGLQFLNDRYLQAVIIGLAGILLMCVIVIGTLLVRRINWLRSKPLSAIGYGLLLLMSLHALMLGNHFANISELIPQLFITALAALLIIEGWWLDQWLKLHYKNWQYGPALVTTVAIVSVFVTVTLFAPAEAWLNVHSDHSVTGAAGLDVPQPSSQLLGQIVKTYGDFQVSLISPTKDNYMRLQVKRISTPFSEAVGQAQVLMVNQSTYESFTLSGELEAGSDSVISFKFPLTGDEYVPGVYAVYAKFYLTTGALRGEFSVALP